MYQFLFVLTLMIRFISEYISRNQKLFRCHHKIVYLSINSYYRTHRTKEHYFIFHISVAYFLVQISLFGPDSPWATPLIRRVKLRSQPLAWKKLNAWQRYVFFQDFLLIFYVFVCELMRLIIPNEICRILLFYSSLCFYIEGSWSSSRRAPAIFQRHHIPSTRPKHNT